MTCEPLEVTEFKEVCDCVNCGLAILEACGESDTADWGHPVTRGFILQELNWLLTVDFVACDKTGLVISRELLTAFVVAEG